MEKKTYLAAAPLKYRIFADRKAGVVQFTTNDCAVYSDRTCERPVTLLPEEQSHYRNGQHDDHYEEESTGLLHYTP